MTRLAWDADTPRIQSGIDRGVLYPSSGPGVAWNGLTAVDHVPLAVDTEPLYFDGRKYMDFVGNRNFQAVLHAYGAPEEFGPCIGNISAVKGFVLTRQPKTTFGLSYRTLIGDNFGYKIHLIYSALATPVNGRSYATQADTPTAELMSWTIDAKPQPSTTYKGTARFTVDSTKVSSSALAALETLLYGTSTVDPALPSVATVIGLF